MICTPSPATANATAGPSTRTHARTRSIDMFGPSTCSCASGMTFPFPGPAPIILSQRELYLRALEREREEILTEAYAARRSPTRDSFAQPSSDPKNRTRSSSCDLAECPSINGVPFDERGRQLDFAETVRQRQARLEFLRRQEFARRLAHRGLEDAAASAYAIRRLPPPRALPGECVNAVIKIQRAYKAHLAARSRSSEMRYSAPLFNHAFTLSSSPSSSSLSLSDEFDAEWSGDDTASDTSSECSLDSETDADGDSAEVPLVEDDDEEEYDDGISTSRAAALAALFAARVNSKRRRRRSSSASLRRSPVSRSPSLASIPEVPDPEFDV